MITSVTANIAVALYERMAIKTASEVTSIPMVLLDTFMMTSNDQARELGAKPNFKGVQAAGPITESPSVLCCWRRPAAGDKSRAPR